MDRPISLGSWGSGAPRGPGGLARRRGRAPAPLVVVHRLLVLGHHLHRLVRDGVVKDYTELATVSGMTPARVTQIVNLTLLAPDVQEAILFATCNAHEWNVRRAASTPDWNAHRRALSLR